VKDNSPDESGGRRRRRDIRALRLPSRDTPQSLNHCTSGNVTAQAAVVDFTEPTTQASSGCEPADFQGVTGKVVLLRRGTCDFGQKAEHAQAAGAVAAVIFK
jgi:hypothetical protein